MAGRLTRRSPNVIHSLTGNRASSRLIGVLWRPTMVTAYRASEWEFVSLTGWQKSVPPGDPARVRSMV
jgi:hypothetical protein